MPKVRFFPEKKRMNENFAYVLEFMLTFDKMQNTSPLMCTKLDMRTENFESYSSFLYCMHSSVYRVVLSSSLVSK